MLSQNVISRSEAATASRTRSRNGIKDRQVARQRPTQTFVGANAAMIDPADPAGDRVQRPQRLLEKWLARRSDE